LLASRVLSRPRVEKLEDTLLNLEKLDDARQIGKLLTACFSGPVDAPSLPFACASQSFFNDVADGIEVVDPRRIQP
jgi:hypothetical protein